MKKSFIIYDNWALMISQMPNEEAGQLIKKICKYKIKKYLLLYKLSNYRIYTIRYFR